MGHFDVFGALKVMQRLRKLFGAKIGPFCVCSLCCRKMHVKWPFWTPSIHKMGPFLGLRVQNGAILCADVVHLALFSVISALQRLHTQNGAFCFFWRF